MKLSSSNPGHAAATTAVAGPAAASAQAPSAPPPGKLDWRLLLQWLRDDGWIGAADAQRVARRFGAADSTQHPLVRLANAGLVRSVEGAAGDGAALDVEALTQWLAGRAGLP